MNKYDILPFDTMIILTSKLFFTIDCIVSWGHLFYLYLTVFSFFDSFGNNLFHIVTSRDSRRKYFTLSVGLPQNVPDIRLGVRGLTGRKSLGLGQALMVSMDGRGAAWVLWENVTCHSKCCLNFQRPSDWTELFPCLYQFLWRVTYIWYNPTN